MNYVIISIIVILLAVNNDTGIDTLPTDNHFQTPPIQKTIQK